MPKITEYIASPLKKIQQGDMQNHRTTNEGEAAEDLEECGGCAL
jgi:hypothetical protein